jgi:membrane-associated protease RseP (regulator of RpoE activity)
MNPKTKAYIIHSLLFVVTIITTTLAGAEWMFGKFLFYGEERTGWDDFINAFQFSIPFIGFLTFHEFGHYFTARYHQIKTTLPYYIPLWLGFIAMPSFGTMGAFIKIKSLIHSRKEYFDVGVAGPLAGFVIAIGIIFYGFSHLPEPEYIFDIHPEYKEYGLDYADHVYQDSDNISITFGNNLIYWWFENYFVSDRSRLPHPNEIIHYPYLLAGYLALFFTALNLLPIGQLDGGHVIFSLFGEKKARMISAGAFTLFLFYSGIGWVDGAMLADTSMDSFLGFVLMIAIYIYFLYISVSSMFLNKRDRFMYAGIMFTIQYFMAEFTSFEGYSGWLLFAFLLGRFLGVYHPRVSDNRPLDPMRQIIAWIAILVFILSFSPRPLIIS